MNSDTILWFLCNLAELGVIGLLAHRRVWHTFPVFFAYSIWSLLGNAGLVSILHWYPPSSQIYVSTYLGNMFVDSVLMFGVMVELAWSVLRPVRASLPQSARFAVAVGIAALGGAIWVFVSVPGHLPKTFALLARLQQTSSILQILVFLVLISSSHLLSLGWRNREMQIATGFGFYSFVNLAAAMLRTHMSTWAQYSHLNQFVVASYLATMLYWAISFAQIEPERRKFTPEMQRILLAAAGTARSARITLTNHHSGNTKK